METIPLGSVTHLINKPEPKHFHSLCYALVSMAHTGREDALTFLFGLAYRNRDDTPKMLILLQAANVLCHPEFVTFFASEFIRVPSLPSTRTYRTAIIEFLEGVDTQESWQALLDLSDDTRVGVRFRERIRRYIDSEVSP